MQEKTKAKKPKKKQKRRYVPTGNPIGRPCTITAEQIAKLEHAYLMDANDQEAAFYAGITKDALHRYHVKHPEFRERSKQLRQNVRFRSKVLVGESILKMKDVGDAKWYLERRAKDEFSTKVEQDLNATHRHVIEELPDEDLDALLEKHFSSES